MNATRPQPVRSPLLDSIQHGFFTREGGVSEGLFSSLNLGMRNADSRTNVLENRRRVASVLAVGPENLAIARQVHGIDHVRADKSWQSAPLPDPDLLPEADAVISDNPAFVAAVLTADCVPVLIAGEGGRIVAAIHAGWRSALAGIVENVVSAMADMGCARAGMMAAVGPSIRQPSYEVGADYRQQFVERDPDSARFFTTGEQEKPRFDLPGYVVGELDRSGVGRIDDVAMDTCADQARFFSNRRAFKQAENGFGLQVSAIRAKR